MELKDNFEVVNLETGATVKCVKLWGSTERWVCSWTQPATEHVAAGDLSYEYSRQEIEDSFTRGVIKNKEEEVKLAEKFMFVSTDEGTTIYTAEETATGDYRVSWLDDGHSNFKTVPYDRESVYAYIVSGAWIVKKVFPKAEQPALKYVGRTIISTVGSPYTLKAHESGTRYVLVGANGAEHDHSYDEEVIERNIAQHGWKWLEPEVSLEPSDDVSDNVIAVWPFPVSTVVDTLLPNGQPEPEFLPPDDIEPLPDYGITLSSVRESVRSLQSAGWVVEVCADFYTVRQDGDVYSNKFVASSEEDLAAIFQAIRTLDKFVDRG